MGFPGPGFYLLTGAIPESVDYIHSVIRHSEFNEVTKQAWIRHHDSGPETNISYVLMGAWSQWGQWGMVEYIGQSVEEAQEYKAAIKLYDLPYPNLKSATVYDNKKLTQESASEAKVVVFPNPAEDNINITFNVEAEQRYVEIINMEGVVIKEINTSENEVTLDISEINPGMYMIMIRCKNENIIKKLIVK